MLLELADQSANQLSQFALHCTLTLSLLTSHSSLQAPRECRRVLLILAMQQSDLAIGLIPDPEEPLREDGFKILADAFGHGPGT